MFGGACWACFIKEDLLSCILSTVRIFLPRSSGDCLVAGGNAAIKPEEWRNITYSSQGTVPRGRRVLAPISSSY